MRRKGRFLHSPILFLVFVLYLVLASSVVFYVHRAGSYQKKLVRENVVQEGISRFDSILVMRKWNASMGGVFVEERSGLRPNPYLKNNHIYSRDGHLLIRVNPAWMTRQISEIGAQDSRFQFHITSLRPVNPANHPRDDFEKTALRYFDKNASSPYYFQFQTSSEDRNISGFDFMGALVTKEECIQCHGDYHIGEIRGGIRINFPLDRYRREMLVIDHHNRFVIGVLVLLFSVVFALLFALFWFMERRQSDTEQLNVDLQREVEDRTEELSSITASMGEGLYVLDDARNLLYMNPAAEKMLGYTFAELKGREIHDVFHYRNREGMRIHPDDCPIHRGLETGRIYKSDEELFVTRSGELLDVALTATPMVRSGRVMGSVAVFQDIRKRREHELSLRRLNQMLEGRIEQEARMRRDQEQILSHQSRLAAMGEMVGSIAHQWRQPLNTISILAQDLQDAYRFGEMDTGYLDESVRRVLEQVQFMSDTIDDFRDFFRPNREMVLFEPVKALEDVVGLMRTQLQNRGIGIEIRCRCGEEVLDLPKGDVTCKSCHRSAYGYPNEFKHAILNILANARDAVAERMKKTGREGEAAGLIEIEVEAPGDRCTIRIRDNGGGIPDSVMARLFDPYFTTKDREGGTGIGLYMAKKIIEEKMGGTIHPSNWEGGAIFTVEIPLPGDVST